MTDDRLPVKKNQDMRIRHTLWTTFKKSKIDGRTALGKTMSFLRRELVRHCGGSPSITETIIIERAIAKTIKCHLYELSVLSDPANSPGSRDHYLALSNSLRLDLQALGLKPKAAEKVLDLKSYVKEKYGKKEQ
jgi:hypothetical protein